MALLGLDSSVRSAKRISERDATRSREGFALDVLVVLQVDAPEDPLDEGLEGTRLSGLERVIDCLRGALSLGNFVPSGCGTDGSGGHAGDVGVVSVICGLLEETSREAPELREFVAL